jgi:hypothetical protein
LMAKTETPGNSNWVVQSWANTLLNGKIGQNQELSDVKPCTTFKKGWSSASDSAVQVTGNECTYYDTSNLRYIYMY